MCEREEWGVWGEMWVMPRPEESDKHSCFRTNLCSKLIFSSHVRLMDPTNLPRFPVCLHTTMCTLYLGVGASDKFLFDLMFHRQEFSECSCLLSGCLFRLLRPEIWY